jgi:hypothetical protein
MKQVKTIEKDLCSMDKKHSMEAKRLKVEQPNFLKRNFLVNIATSN